MAKKLSDKAGGIDGAFGSKGAKEVKEIIEVEAQKETKKPTPKKATPKPKQKQFIPSFIMIFNGSPGSGKSKMADLFPTPFIADFEYGKNIDSIPYSDEKQIQELRIGTMEDIKKNKSEIDIVDAQSDNLKDTWENYKKILKWWKAVGYKNHQTLVIDTGYWLRKSRTAEEEHIKGRQIVQFEYRPVTEENQELMYKLIKHCRKYSRNLIIVTHWMGDYESHKNERGFPESVKIGIIPDVKPWILDAVTWRVNFLKPEESGLENKFIVYLDKAPKYQYAKLDITDKSLFDIINDLDTFKQEIELLKETIESKRNGGSNIEDAFGNK